MEIPLWMVLNSTITNYKLIVTCQFIRCFCWKLCKQDDANIMFVSTFIF